MKKECNICGEDMNGKEYGKLSLGYTTYSTVGKKQEHGTWADNICIKCCKRIHNYVRVISKEE